jgi:chorismate mutase
MAQNEALGSIDEHRERIDELDERIVALLNERQQEALAIRALKPEAKMGLFDPKREEQIFERVEQLSQGPLYGEDLRAIYGTILRVSKEMHA